jgi:RHS repeat-associated protein
VGHPAVYTSSGILNYSHSDWLGSSRLLTTPSRTLYVDEAYAPYGEPYAASGSWVQFTSNGNQWTASGVDDFMFRHYHPVQGRWISPDPAGLAAANPADPQSGNRYAYVGNRPLNTVDPLGLEECDPFFDVTCGGCAPQDASCDPEPPCDPISEFCDPFFPLPPGDGGGPGGGGPGPRPGPKGGNHGPWANNETLGLPTGLNLKPMGLAELIGLSPGTSCDWVCVTIGNGVFIGVTGTGTADSPWIYHVIVYAVGIRPANNGQQQRQQPQQSRLNQASKAALHTFVFGQAIGTGVGCGVGVLVATGVTVATETYPLAGATVPAGCVGGGLIGFFEALPYSGLGAIADFGWTYWGH